MYFILKPEFLAVTLHIWVVSSLLIFGAAPLSHFKYCFCLGIGHLIYFKQEQIGAIIPQADLEGNSQNRGNRIDFFALWLQRKFHLGDSLCSSSDVSQVNCSFNPAGIFLLV